MSKITDYLQKSTGRNTSPPQANTNLNKKDTPKSVTESLSRDSESVS